MTGFAQCRVCWNIYKFPIIDDTIPPCPRCGEPAIKEGEKFTMEKK